MFGQRWAKCWRERYDGKAAWSSSYSSIGNTGSLILSCRPAHEVLHCLPSHTFQETDASKRNTQVVTDGTNFNAPKLHGDFNLPWSINENFVRPESLEHTEQHYRTKFSRHVVFYNGLKKKCSCKHKSYLSISQTKAKFVFTFIFQNNATSK
jgi:hypothetical protein